MVVASLLVSSAFFADSSLRSAPAVVCILDSTPNNCTQYGKKGFGEEKNVSGRGNYKGQGTAVG